MRVAMDARALIAGGGGLRRYTAELLRGLLALDVSVSAWIAGWHIDGLRDALVAELAALGVSPPVGVTRAPGKWLYERPGLWLWAHWPRWAPLPRLLPADLDLFHAIHWPLPLDRRRPLVLTIHDLIALRHPDWVPPNVLAVHRAIAALAPRAAQVIVDSEATRQDVLELSRVAPERVTVVPLGVRPEVFGREVSAGERAAVRQRHQLHRPYFLTVGSIEPRRNIAAIIEAYDLFRERGGADWDLVIVGSVVGHVPGFEQVAGRSRPGTVSLIEHVPDGDLTVLMQDASGFVFASLAEGFGLPVLEAFTAGCPVIASNTTSLPEVAGQAALLVDPADAEAIAAAMLRLVGEPELGDELRHRGRERAAEFTWERTARQTLEVYRGALA